MKSKVGRSDGNTLALIYSHKTGCDSLANVLRCPGLEVTIKRNGTAFERTCAELEKPQALAWLGWMKGPLDQNRTAATDLPTNGAIAAFLQQTCAIAS
ncbi:MAG: hypothetical protein JJD98_06190 [Polaromonas sp.]|nr:hypothetical protein [Polaromonas sp.]